MKKFIAVAFLVLFVALSFLHFVEARVSVRGYTRSNGTYVQPYSRTSPNSYKFDNYSSRGNYNPYTGKKGYGRW